MCFKEFKEVIFLRKSVISIGVLTILLIVGLFTIQVNTYPPSSTRIILEHTYETYITPVCYEQAEKTNNLAESTLEQATALHYKPESACTSKSLEPLKQPIANFFAEKLGIRPSKWTW